MEKQFNKTKSDPTHGLFSTIGSSTLFCSDLEQLLNPTLLLTFAYQTQKQTPPPQKKRRPEKTRKMQTAWSHLLMTLI